jgi:phage baseplate assembly protein gpV
MSSALFDSIARIARHETNARATAGVGKVTSIYPADGVAADYAATVEMRDSGLVLPRVPVAAGVLGAAAIPAVGELVVVVFMDGDYNAPVIVGRLYHPDQNLFKQIVLALPSGAEDPNLTLEVDGTKPSVRLELPGSEVRIDIVEKEILIQVGEVAVTVQGSGGGRAEIAAGGSKITLKKDGDITIAASSSKLTLKANEIEIAGSSRVKISGA